MRTSHRIALAALAAGSLALTGCVSTNTGGGGAEGEEIIIGAVVAETGFMSPYDTPAINSLRIAVDELNAEGGIDGAKVVLEVVDTGTDFEQYAPLAQQVIDGGAKVLIVTCDYDTSVPAALVAEESNVLNIAPCIGDPIYGPEGGLDIGFSMGNGTPGESVVMAEFAAGEGWKSAVFLTDTSIKYTQNQCEIARARFAELGGTEIANYDFVQGDSIAETVSKISAGPAPDVIFNCSYAPGGALVAKELRDGGINTPIVSGFGMDGTFWHESIPGLSDYYVSTYPSIMGDDPSADVNDFAFKYEEAYGERPSSGSFVTGPSTLEAIVKAYKAAGSWDGDKLAAEFLKFDNTEFLVGPTKFSKDLHINVERPQRIMQVQDGQYSFLKELAPEKVVFAGQ